MQTGDEITLYRESTQALTVASPNQVPAIVLAAGEAGKYAWDEFFSGQLRNLHTRTAYRRAVERFLRWVEPQGVSIAHITPGMVGSYFDEFKASQPTKKLHLAALRAFFDNLTQRHVVVLNPAASVRGERYQVVEGKTPEISIEEVRKLLASIHLTKAMSAQSSEETEPLETVPNLVGLRDRAVIGVMIYTAARAGAIAKLLLKHFIFDGTQYMLRFEEKGGKSREIPVRHDLQRFIKEYIEVAQVEDAPRDTPLFRTTYRRSGLLTGNAMSGVDLCRMVKRRLKDACLRMHLSPHSFRVTTMTDLLNQGVPLADVQYLAGHADPRTTRLYDRRTQRVTRNLVEKISI